MSPDINPLHSIRTFNQLVKYLRDELDWPIESDDFDELTFDYAPEELGLDAETAVKIKEIKQLRPLANKQPWGIFFVNFAPKQLPVVALRRILSTLVIKKRRSANQPHQAAWRLHDLLFISSYGETDHRDITFAHFAEEHGTGDLPTLRLIGWDDEDTKLKLDFVEHELNDKLRWPEDESDIAGWRTRWSAAFRLRPREVIKTSQQLAIRLADLARSIRKRANNVLAVESDRGPLRKMHTSFKEALIHDLSCDDFADMYAQTISYGLLTARISRPAALVADNLGDMVPVTNPFLKDMLETFLKVGGRKGAIDFDELGVNEVVQLLRDADMEAVLRDFGDRNPQEDPVIHFYELFLKEYDSKKRMQRGVFYTPRPVVSFIVRSVHETLQKEFGIEDGLADTITWGVMAKRDKALQIPRGVSPEEPFVQILDPAAGTGTFLVEAIEVIRLAMEGRWKKQGYMPLEFERLWNEYVPESLLPRLHGFELMMAPYAIAHMKIGLKLYETGYRFGSNKRARVYLTNTLEPPSDDKKQREFEDWVPALAHEANAVNAVKRHQRFTVLIGNPPYSLWSQNLSEAARSIVHPYRLVDGQPIKEKGALQFEKILQDDYIKFFRVSQVQIDQSGFGVLGLITNHSFLDNPTLRGMRRSLLNSFDQIACINLHGNSAKKEVAPDGTEDVNVFDIMQGVAIFLGTRRCKASSFGSPTLLSCDLWGPRQSKYDSLRLATLKDLPFQLFDAQSPLYLLRPQNDLGAEEYAAGWRIPDIFQQGSMGVVTARDHISIGFDDQGLLAVATEFRDSKLGDAEICEKLSIPLKKGWDVAKARSALRREKHLESFIQDIDYRPFDRRRIFYHSSLVWGRSWPTMQHILGKENVGLSTTRSIEAGVFRHALCSKRLIGHHFVSLKEVNYFYPLWIYQVDGELELDNGRRPNLSPNFVAALFSALSVPFPRGHGIAEDISPDEIFAYLFAILFSPEYRLRYDTFLRQDFPRVPLTRDPKLFRALARIGSQLIALHLLESPELAEPIGTYSGRKNPEVAKPTYARKTVWLDKEQTCGFKGVPEAVWEFHIGGYQVCEKWLKDRKGRTLSKDDIAHYHKIVVALSETIRLMKKIDEVIEEHGGWPGAFSTKAK